MVGRLGKSVAKADPDAGASTGKTGSDAFTSRPAPDTYADPAYPVADTYVAPTYPAAETSSTEYAATGTGVPAVVEDSYGYGEKRL